MIAMLTTGNRWRCAASTIYEPMDWAYTLGMIRLWCSKWFVGGVLVQRGIRCLRTSISGRCGICIAIRVDLGGINLEEKE